MKRLTWLWLCGVVWWSGALPAAGASPGRKLSPEDALKKKVERYAVKGSFRAVLVDLASQAGVTFRVDWAALAKAGVTDKTQVAVELDNVLWRQVLEVVLSRVSRGGSPIGWRADSGDIIISTHKQILEMEGGAKVAAASLRPRQVKDASKRVEEVMPRAAVPEIQFNKLPFRDVLTFFKTVTKANFHINWRAMEQAGIDPQTPIDLDVRGISTGRAMDLVFSQVNADHDKFTSVYWVVHRGVVLISTGNDLNRELITKVIDAGGALLVQPDSVGPRIDFGQATQDMSNMSQSGGGGNNAGGLFLDEDERDRGEQPKSYAEQKKEQTEKLIATIKGMTGPDMWDPEGKGSVRVINSKIIITQTLLGFKLLEKALR